jgi:DNA topoisomerase I
MGCAGVSGTGGGHIPLIMSRLRRVDCSTPGITRKGRGRGFEYFLTTGEKVTDPETLQRIRDLAIPPAWKDVWICPEPNGHLQAVGTDDAGRRQYRYHDLWRVRRDLEKFDEMLGFARRLPAMRQVLAEHLAATDALTRQRVLACAARLLDHGFFRIGTEEYAETNDSYGLATMRKEHVTLLDGAVEFDYTGKSGKRRIQQIVDPAVYEVVGKLKRRRTGGEELLAYRDGDAWVDVSSRDINDYVKQVVGEDYSAKDFRTWNATVIAAVALAVSGGAATSDTARKRAKARAVKEVAHYLGNTPAVARSSYIDPRIFDRFEDGWTISGALHDLADAELGAPSIQGAVEEAVIDLLEERKSSPAVEQVGELASSVEQLAS